MLDDEGQFIMTPDLESRGSGGRDRICASSEQPLPMNRGFFQGDFRELLPSNTYQLISRWFSCNSSNNNCLCWFYHIINCAIGFTLHYLFIVSWFLITASFLKMRTMSSCLLIRYPQLWLGALWYSGRRCYFRQSARLHLSLISPLLAVCNLQQFGWYVHRAWSPHLHMRMARIFSFFCGHFNICFHHYYGEIGLLYK